MTLRFIFGLFSQHCSFSCCRSSSYVCVLVRGHQTYKTSGRLRNSSENIKTMEKYSRQLCPPCSFFVLVESSTIWRRKKVLAVLWGIFLVIRNHAAVLCFDVLSVLVEEEGTSRVVGEVFRRRKVLAVWSDLLVTRIYVAVLDLVSSTLGGGIRYWPCGGGDLLVTRNATIYEETWVSTDYVALFTWGSQKIIHIMASEKIILTKAALPFHEI